MKREYGITLVNLVVTIIILIILAGISINILVGENGIIIKAKQAKQNIILAEETETMRLNQLYYELEKEEETIGAGADDLTNATEDKILKDYIVYSKGRLMVGTMSNNGVLNGNLNCGENYVIPEGYTSGGTIIANSLGSQTEATATAKDIAEGKTAYVNGEKVVGTGKFSGLTVIASDLTSTGKQMVDCTSIEGYQDLSIDNFLIQATSIYYLSGVPEENYSFNTIIGSFELVYDSDAGILTIEKNYYVIYDASGNRRTCAVKYNLLLH